MYYAQPTIAVVDNDCSIRAFFEDLLGDTYTVATFGCTHKTYTSIVQSAPALIILDLGVPGSNNGWNMLYKLRKRPLTAITPLIVCSTDKQLLERCTPKFLRLQVFWQHKPFNIDAFLSTIALLLAPASAFESNRLVFNTKGANCEQLLLA